MFKVNDADAAAAARPQEDENADGAVALTEAEPEAGAVAQPLLRWNTEAVNAALPGENRNTPKRVQRFIRDNYAARGNYYERPLFTVPGIISDIFGIHGELLAADPARAGLLTVSRSTVVTAIEILKDNNELIKHNPKAFTLKRALSEENILALREELSKEVNTIMNYICARYEIGDTFTELEVIFWENRYSRFTYQKVEDALTILKRNDYLEVASARRPEEPYWYSLK